MRFMKPLLVASTAVSLLAAPAIAQDGSNPAIGARQALMQLYAFNLGQLGAMAKGAVDYDSAAASAAAANLVSLAMTDQSAMWPQGTDSDSDATSRALPIGWTQFEDAAAKGMAMGEAATAMKEAAGKDLESLQAAMGPLGKSCGDCHKVYRKPKG